MSRDDLQKEADAFEQDINKALNNNSKWVTTAPKVNSQPWYNDKLLAMNKHLTNISNALGAKKQCEKDGKKRRFNTSYTFEQRKEDTKHFKRACRVRKRRYEQGCVNDVATPNDMVKLSKVLNKKDNIQMGLQSDDNGNPLSPKKSVEVVADHFFIGS